jgi:1-acyl-sn-glycerol-3-phosphate acyltransferase
MTSTPTIRYPRKAVIRTLLRWAGRLLIPLLAKIEIRGLERLPKQGPVILAGNHVAVMEVLLMVIYSPAIVELIGTGDIPIDPTFAPIARLYDFIPINRGNVDRVALQKALEVLQQKGVLGIFPEGGIWNPDGMRPQIGVAWLSHTAQAPVIPIGFGGMRGALKAMLRLKRPTLQMNVGQAIPPLLLEDPFLSKKEVFEQASRRILTQIHDLIPPVDRQSNNHKKLERYTLQILAFQPGKQDLHSERYQEHLLPNGPALAKLLDQPVLLDVFVRNLHLSAVRPFQQLNRRHSAGVIRLAAQTVLDYLEINRGFLTYRFGMDEGLAMRAGLAELRDLAAQAELNGCLMQLTPLRHYSDSSASEILEQHTGI